jgi:hypothetical protein
MRENENEVMGPCGQRHGHMMDRNLVHSKEVEKQEMYFGSRNIVLYR